MIAPPSGSPGDVQLTAKVRVHHRNLVVTQKVLTSDRPAIQQPGTRNGMRMRAFAPGRRVVPAILSEEPVTCGR